MNGTSSLLKNFSRIFESNDNEKIRHRLIPRISSLYEELVRRFLLIVFVLVVLLLAMCSPTHAWKWKTHHDVVEAAFNALPPEVRVNLNLNEIKQGSIAPDKEDFGHPHTYPNTLFQALYWFENARREYSAGRYSDASYALGVASHSMMDAGMGEGDIDEIESLILQNPERIAEGMPLLGLNELRSEYRKTIEPFIGTAAASLCVEVATYIEGGAQNLRVSQDSVRADLSQARGTTTLSTRR